MVFVLSVGGGSLEKNISPNLVLALQLAKQVGAQIVGIVGRDGGYTAQGQNVYVKIPVTNTRGESACQLVRCLTRAGVKVSRGNDPVG
jgi:ACT domain-containing protein